RLVERIGSIATATAVLLLTHTGAGYTRAASRPTTIRASKLECGVGRSAFESGVPHRAHASSPSMLSKPHAGQVISPLAWRSGDGPRLAAVEQLAEVARASLLLRGGELGRHELVVGRLPGRA